MAITNGYCTLAELKARIGNFEDGVTTWDSQLESIIESVSRFIDRDRRRVFYTTAGEARYWTPKHSDRLWIDDATTITTVEVATSTNLSYTEWAATDYLTEPFNRNDGPIMMLRIHPSSSRYFVPNLHYSAKITATWGYAASVPTDVKEVCILLAQYVWFRKDAPFGNAGFAALGEITANPSLMPSDIRGMLSVIPMRVMK